MLLRARKSFTYNTRHLKAGDEFEPKRDLDARILCGIGKAEPVRTMAEVPAPPGDIASKIAAATAPSEQPAAPPAPDPIPSAAPVDDLTALRAEYRERIGRAPFNGWGAETLRQKIAEATSDNVQ